MDKFLVVFEWESEEVTPSVHTHATEEKAREYIKTRSELMGYRPWKRVTLYRLDGSGVADEMGAL